LPQPKPSHTGGEQLPTQLSQAQSIVERSMQLEPKSKSDFPPDVRGRHVLSGRPRGIIKSAIEPRVCIGPAPSSTMTSACPRPLENEGGTRRQHRACAAVGRPGRDRQSRARDGGPDRAFGVAGRRFRTGRRGLGLLHRRHLPGPAETGAGICSHVPALYIRGCGPGVGPCGEREDRTRLSLPRARTPPPGLWVGHHTAGSVTGIVRRGLRAVSLLARLGDRPALMAPSREAQLGERARIGDVDPVDRYTAVLPVKVLESGAKGSGKRHANGPSRPTRGPSHGGTGSMSSRAI